MTISVPSGRSHRIVVSPAITVNVAMHLSLHPDGEAAPDPNALPDGARDPAERRRRPPGPLAGARVEIEGTGVSATTARNGTCKLPIAAVPDGDHILVITPPSGEDAGPLVPGGAPRIRNQPSPAQLVAPSGVDFAYRGTRVAITLEALRLKTHPRIAVATDTHARVLKGATPTSLEVDIKPDWVRDANAAPRTQTLELVLVHHTGGTSLTGNLSTFVSTNKSIHYLMDLDGHVIKMVNDGEVASHAGKSRWAGRTSVSERSVGIEICNGGAPYTPEQVNAVVELVDQILIAQTLPRHHVVGHEDVGTGDDKTPPVRPITLVGRKGGDPGATFPWQALEARGMALQLTNPPPNDAVMYAGVFATRDRMPATPGPHVIELRVDLDAIGYSLNNVTSNAFDDHVTAAVFAFQRHFTTLGRRARNAGEPPLIFGSVDVRTAREIKRCTRF